MYAECTSTVILFHINTIVFINVKLYAVIFSLRKDIVAHDMSILEYPQIYIYI